MSTTLAPESEERRAGQPVTPAEQRLLAELQLHTRIDLAGDGSGEIRGTFLQHVLTQEVVTAGTVSLVLENAVVTGDLDLSFRRVPCAVTLARCVLEDELLLSRAHLEELDLQGSTLKELRGDQVTVRCDLRMDGSEVHGPVDLTGARVGGSVRARQAVFDACFQARGITVGGQLDLSEARLQGPGSGERVVLDHVNIACGANLQGLQANGPVRMVYARIGGDLDCSSARLDWTGERGEEQHPAPALMAGSAVIGGTLNLSGVDLHGEIYLIGARMRALTCEGGRLDNPNGPALSAEYCRIELEAQFDGSLHGSLFTRGGLLLRGAQVGGHVTVKSARVVGDIDFRWLEAGGEVSIEDTELFSDLPSSAYLSGARLRGGLTLHGSRISGDLDLQNAWTTFFADDETSWPHGHLLATGFVYEKIAYTNESVVGERTRWLAKQNGDTHHPEAWEQLIDVLRKHGSVAQARDLAIAKEEDYGRKALRFRVRPFARGWHWIVGRMVGHGYRPGRAVAVAFVLFLIGAALFSRGVMEDVRIQAGPQPEMVYSRWMYSLDALLPIVDLHQEDVWLPGKDHPFIWGYLWLQIGAGWLVATLVVAAVTGVIKR